MFRLAHLSDVHLGPLPPVPWRQLVSKRVTGWLNWHRNRAGAMGSATLDTVTADMLAHAPDHIAVTGDMTNLALPPEIARASEWLGDLGPRESVSVIPGNHDAYVPGALDVATRAWAANMTGERAGGDYPYLRRVGPLAIFGCSTAEATLPFRATGPFRADQAERLAELLRNAGEESLFRVVLIHHPPIEGAAKWMKRMLGIGRFERAVARAGAELVLHGHTHLPTRYGLARPHEGHLSVPRPLPAPVPVIGVPAAGQGPSGHRPAGGFNLFEVEGEPGAWRCRLTRHAIGADGAVKETERCMLIGDD